MKILQDNTTREFIPPQADINNIESVKTIISDQAYFHYITFISNGGLYFEKSLHLYGFCNSPSFHNILEVNDVFRKEYTAIIAEGKFIFGQDVFGNQLAFTVNGIFSINAETGDSEFLARGFADWLELLSEDTEYLTGINFSQLWESSGHRLEDDQRLCAKKPFVIGGEFAINNIYAQSYPNYLASNANIARQIHGKPNGTKVEFKTID